MPIDLGGHASGLAEAQRQLGHEAEAISLHWSPLGFNGDTCLEPPPGSRHRLLRRELGRFSLLWRTLRAADVVHCHFGQTALSVRAFPLREANPSSELGESLRLAYARLLWLKDLSLWRATGKTLAMTFYGDDIRSIEASVRSNPYSHLALPEIAGPLRRRNEFRSRYLDVVDRNVQLIYAVNPDLLPGLPSRARWLAYSHCNPSRQLPRPWPGEARPLRLLHMPTNRAVKGTAALIAAVERLRAEGHALHLTLVEDRQNAQALAELDSHHVLIDQLRVGWYGGVAVEAMMAGRPVVCYIHEADLARTPSAFANELPIMRANPDTIEGVLRGLLGLSEGRLREMGEQARRFVETWHDPAQIAASVLDDYAGLARSPGKP